MKNNNKFRKTEQLLYNYIGFKNSIKFKEEYIAFIKKYGLQETSKGFVGGIINININKDDLLDEKIKDLKEDIRFTQKCVKYIDLALDTVRDDNYYELIEMKYFEGKSMEYIAEYYDTATITVYRNRDRLIHKIKNYIFAEDVLKIIFNRKVEEECLME